MKKGDFEKLEKLNAEIDVWIDEENFSKVSAEIESKLSDGVKSVLETCFPKDEHCTNKSDKYWQDLLSPEQISNPDNKSDIKTIPMTTVRDVELDPSDELEEAWSHLFYAKLLRAKIQQKSYSDCYTRRFDDVAWYLGKHLPDPKKKGGKSPKDLVHRLTLIYLMELSAASQDWEALGYSERARRVVQDAIHSVEKDNEPDAKIRKSPFEFYELWARYNIGVAYFHQGYYRKAVLEFNRIIWQVQKWETDNNSTANREFYKHHSGKKLLLLPAILYRAEVQIKLQIAYHALNTLKEGDRWRGFKKIRATLMEAQAFQYMGRLDKSWSALKKVSKGLKLKDLSKPLKCVFPNKEDIDKCDYPGLAERFFDILIEDHLQWLTLEGGYQKRSKDEVLQYFLASVRYGKDALKDKTRKETPEKIYIDGIKAIEPYLQRLNEAFKQYFEFVEFHKYNRNGYLQQLAKYLRWLSKVSDLGVDLKSKETKDRSNVISQIASGVYTERKDNILEKEPGKSTSYDCPHCGFKGIDLRRIELEHYSWFTEAMLTFFNSEKMMATISTIKGDKGDKSKFVKRLIELEREERGDLRIRDLELRYELSEPKGLLSGNNKENYEYAHWLCWNDLVTKEKKKGKEKQVYLELLQCSRTEPDKGNSDSRDYEQVMKRWDDHFLSHLESPSVHDSQEKSFYFLGLQRWNSSSPAKGYSLGGGYLLYHLNKNKEVDMGVAIDPGFDFVRNLFHAGFSLDDIDVVLISHAHLDHIRDLESIVALLFELKKRGKKEKRVHIILSLGAYKRLEHIMEDSVFRYIVEPYIIDVEREIDVDYFENFGSLDKKPGFQFESYEDRGNRYSIERVRPLLPPKRYKKRGIDVEIKPMRAFHDDTTRSDSFGFIITLKGNGEQELTFGYTGDTKWIYPNMDDPLNKNRIWQDISSQYKDCDALLVHLGSLIKRHKKGGYSFGYYDQCPDKNDRYPCEELVRDENHPYLIGMLRLLSDLYKLPKTNHTGMPLILIGEFGEELRGHIRADFVQRLQRIYHDQFAILPIDVGINVRLRRKADTDNGEDKCNCTVWCVQCDNFVDITEADFKLYGTDHALYCVCKTCVKSTPDDVLQNRLRQLYEVGLDVKLSPEL